MTHKLQLLNVRLFSPLKNAWVKHRQECVAKNRSVTCKTIIEEYLKFRGSTCHPRPSNQPSAIVVSGPSTPKSSWGPNFPPAG